MAARTEVTALAGVGIYRQNVRIFFAQPFGRCRRGCAQNHLQPGLSQCVNSAVHPFPSELALALFQTAPGELTDAHIGEAQIAHPLRIASPYLFGPMFGIIANA